MFILFFCLRIYQFVSQNSAGFFSRIQQFSEGEIIKVFFFLLQAMQQELGAREQTVAAMKAAGNVSTASLDELENTWDRVNNLSDTREAKLRDSLKMVTWYYWNMSKPNTK